MTPDSLKQSGRILLISCYEMGHQPLGLASPLTHLERAGFSPAVLDVSLDAVDAAQIRRARLIGISVPMHTAMRLGIRVAEQVRKLNPDCHLVFYGLYAALNAEHLLSDVADSCFGAEFEESLVHLAVALDSGVQIDRFVGPPRVDEELEGARRGVIRDLSPQRVGLANLDRYVKLNHGGEQRCVGYVATTRGCKHGCLHCPIPPVYNNKFYAISVDSVMEDIHNVVASGARHITFADPDFLNGPQHALRIARRLHAHFPDVTFDYTAKVSHLLRYEKHVAELHDLGCVFVLSAFESLSDRTLAMLEKGHTRDDVLRVVDLFGSLGLTLRPSLVPFTPWDTLEDYRVLLRLAEEHELIDCIDPVQYSIRLLIPPGSALFSLESVRQLVGPLDPQKFLHPWAHPDPRMDALQAEVGRVVESAAASGEDPALTFYRVKSLAQSVGRKKAIEPDLDAVRTRFPAARVRPPGLTEAWFC